VTRSHTPGIAASACVAILLFLALKPVQLIMPTADHVLLVCAALLFGIYMRARELDKRPQPNALTLAVLDARYQRLPRDPACAAYQDGSAAMYENVSSALGWANNHANDKGPEGEVARKFQADHAAAQKAGPKGMKDFVTSLGTSARMAMQIDPQTMNCCEILMLKAYQNLERMNEAHEWMTRSPLLNGEREQMTKDITREIGDMVIIELRNAGWLNAEGNTTWQYEPEYERMRSEILNELRMAGWLPHEQAEKKLPRKKRLPDWKLISNTKITTVEPKLEIPHFGRKLRAVNECGSGQQTDTQSNLPTPEPSP